MSVLCLNRKVAYFLLTFRFLLLSTFFLVLTFFSRFYFFLAFTFFLVNCIFSRMRIHAAALHNLTNHNSPPSPNAAILLVDNDVTCVLIGSSTHHPHHVVQSEPKVRTNQNPCTRKEPANEDRGMTVDGAFGYGLWGKRCESMCLWCGMCLNYSWDILESLLLFHPMPSHRDLLATNVFFFERRVHFF